MQTNLNYVNKTLFAMGGLSVKKKEEMSLRKPATTIRMTRGVSEYTSFKSSKSQDDSV